MRHNLDRIKCPLCSKELVALDIPFEELDEWNYRCEDCGISVLVVDTK